MFVFNGEKKGKTGQAKVIKSVKHPWPPKAIKDFSQYIPGANKTFKYQAKRVTNDTEKAQV